MATAATHDHAAKHSAVKSAPSTYGELMERWIAAAAGKRVLLVEQEDDRVHAAGLALRELGVEVLLTHPDDPGADAVGAESVIDRLELAGRLLAEDRVDAVIAGVVSNSPAVLRAALRTVGTAEASGLVSSLYLMLLPDGRVFGYADCVVNPEPDSDALARIASDSARTFTRLVGLPARVAMLSYSTGGVADQPPVARVQRAVALARHRDPSLIVDGEMQLDTAVVPIVGAQKLPGSPVAGTANVLIFPSLEAGNIAYKITERLGGAIAVGPVLQGLRRPYFDISRGCTADDIVRSALLAAVLR